MRKNAAARRRARGRRPGVADRRRRGLFSEPLEQRLVLALTTGLFFNDPGAEDGYVLFSPNTTNDTYLIDKDSNIVNQWQSDYLPGLLGYLLDDGSLIRASSPNGQGGNGFIQAAGSGGLLERFDWNGNLTWTFSYDTPTQLAHHDFEVMPNGNILMIAWELKSETEATDAGRDPSLPGNGYIYADHIIEVKPDLVNGGGQIVWAWHVWDHLVQEFDASKVSTWYGATGVEDHPELIDVNYVSTFDEGGGQAEDWTHSNGIAYNAELDQIILSVREFSEVWIIDHSTSMTEAMGHTGGNSGKGGDLLYRWGNPQTYDRGDANDRVLYYQHDPKWIPDGYPGAGNITVLNNGFGRPGQDYTEVDEFTAPLDVGGNYVLDPGQAYGPTSTVWTYTAPLENFSAIISGAQRLPNGDTHVTYGTIGNFTEVTSAGVEVWKYVNPYTGGGMLGPMDPIPNLGIPDPGLDTLLVNFTFRSIEYPLDFIHPSVDLNGPDAGALDFTSSWSNAGGVNISDSDATITDDGTTLVSVTASLAAVSAGDVLSADTSGTSISASYNSTSGVLTLSNSDTVANYQTVLRSIKYDNTSGGPGVATKTIDIVAEDGDSLTSTTAVATVNVTWPFIDLNGASAGTDHTVSWTAAPVFVADTTALVIDDSVNLTSLTATIVVPQPGDFLLATTTGTPISASYNVVSQTMTLSNSATADQYQQVLRTIRYSNALGGPNVPSFDINFVASDGASTGNTAVSTVVIATVPKVDLNGGQSGINYTTTWSNLGSINLPDPYVAIAFNGAGTTLSSLTASIASPVAGDVLSIGVGGAVGGISASYNSTNGVLTLSGSSATNNYQTTLRRILYDNTLGAQNVDSRTVNFVGYDGATASSTAVATITIQPLTLDLNGNEALGTGYNTFWSNGGAVAIEGASGATAATVADGKAANLVSLTASLSTIRAGDVLSADTTGTSISASYNATSGVLTLSNSDTVANYQTVLRSIKYDNTSGGPGEATKTINLQATDSPGYTQSARATLQIVTSGAQVVGHQLFYNQSGTGGGTVRFDGNDSAINSLDDNAIALDKVAYQPGVAFEIRRLTNNNSIDTNPRIFGTDIVWQVRGGTDAGTDDEIMWYDGTSSVQLSTNTVPDGFPKISSGGIVWERGTSTTQEIIFHDFTAETPVTTNSVFDGNAAISGSRVVWEQTTVNGNEIMSWQGGPTTNLSQNLVGDFLPIVEGNNVVWQSGSGPFQIMLHDGVDPAVPIETDTFVLADPRISGQNIVWEGFNGLVPNTREIYLYDGTNFTQLSTNDFNEFDPQISGQNVVWWGGVFKDNQVYLYDGNSVTPLSTGELNQFPQIDGQNVVWQGKQLLTDDFEIYLWNGLEVIQLTDNNFDDTMPQISGQNVVWQGQNGTDGTKLEIYTATISARVATFTNLSSFSKGINGVMIDLAGAHGTIEASDFIFRVGNDNTPSTTWTTAPAPASVSVRAGAGVGGSDRVEIVWNNNDVQEQWLQVVMKTDAGTDTGLAQLAGYTAGYGDVFYFGNALANSGLGDTSTLSSTTITDELEARNHAEGLNTNHALPSISTSITNIRDYNRSGSVDIADSLLARNNPTTGSGGANPATRYINVAVGSPPALGAGLANDTGPGGIPNSDGITTDPTIAGTLTGVNLIVSFKAGLDAGPVTTDVLPLVQGGGGFTLSAALLDTIGGGSLPDGPHTVHLEAVDDQGLIASVDVPMTLKRSIATPALPDLIVADDTGTSSTDNLTKNNTPRILVSAEPGSLVTLFVDNVPVQQGTAVPGLQFTLSTLSDGSHPIQATAVDGAGNLSAASATLTVSIDTAPPTLTLSSVVPFTDDVTPHLTATGNGVVGQVTVDVDVNDDGDFTDSLETARTTTVLFSNSSFFQLTPALPLTDPLVGAYVVRMRARGVDNAGNEGVSPLLSLEIDTLGNNILEDYVQADDWTATPYAPMPEVTGTGFTMYILDLKSQTWRTIDDVDRPEWHHWLRVYVPDGTVSPTALLAIGSGSNDTSPPPSLTPSATNAGLAVQLQSVVVELPTVPNQSLEFVDDPTHLDRREDEIIAFTFREFMDHLGDPGNETWPALLAMTKSAVAAMGATQALIAQGDVNGTAIDDFIVTGYSKRGWTTWLTAASDDRVKAIIPGVIDVLNMDEQMMHHFDYYSGVTNETVQGFASAIHDYVDFDIVQSVLTDENRELGRIIDPYRYLQNGRFDDMPKLILNASGDEFFVPTSSQYYFSDLPGTQNYLRYVPNSGHSITLGEALNSTASFFDAVVNNVPLPQYSWTVQGGTIILNSTTTPTSVVKYEATNFVERDFRKAYNPSITWTSTTLTEFGGTYVATAAIPATGARAFFIEMTYPSGIPGNPFIFTTEIVVKSNIVAEPWPYYIPPGPSSPAAAVEPPPAPLAAASSAVGAVSSALAMSASVVGGDEVSAAPGPAMTFLSAGATVDEAVADEQSSTWAWDSALDSVLDDALAEPEPGDAEAVDWALASLDFDEFA